MDPEDGEKLKAGGSLTPEDAQAAIKKAMTDSPKFKETFNEVPVFHDCSECRSRRREMVSQPKFFPCISVCKIW